IFFAQLTQLFLVQIVKAQHGVLRILGDTQQFIDLDVQLISVAVLGVLDQEHHEEGDDGGRRVDDQLPGVVVVEQRPGRRPD
nr:hypothetical protein [Tanacetum cinerariifolium]